MKNIDVIFVWADGREKRKTITYQKALEFVPPGVTELKNPMRVFVDDDSPSTSRVKGEQ